MLIYLRQTPSIKLPFGSDCWDCRYVCRHPAGYSDWVRASLRFTHKFLNIANQKSPPPKMKACSLSCCMMYSCQSSVWFFATRGWLSDLSSLGNARKDASNGSIQNPSIHPSTVRNLTRVVGQLMTLEALTLQTWHYVRAGVSQIWLLIHLLRSEIVARINLNMICESFLYLMNLHF